MAMTINSPVRQVKAKVELCNADSTLAATYTYLDKLVSFTIERTADNSKFFGFGVTQKVNVKLLDKERQINPTTAQNMKIYAAVGTDAYTKIAPTFYITEVNRDENTNQLSITAYDRLYTAKEVKVSGVSVTAPYTVKTFLESAIVNAGIPSVVATQDEFTLELAEGGNFDGSESVVEAFDDAAEISQTIYFIDNADRLRFKRLLGSPAHDITREDYFTLTSKTNRKLVEIAHITELGDNVSAKLAVAGTSQYVRDNAFWEKAANVSTLVEDALAAVGGMIINQFTMDWRGNFNYEIGDRLFLETKDGTTALAYLLSDKISYDGSFSQETEWEYDGNDSGADTNSTSISEAIKKTEAKVDKVNNQITLLASSIDNTERDGRIDEIEKKVALQLTPEQLSIEVSEQLQGIDGVDTKMGFKFNKDGLNLSKEGAATNTQLNEDGMVIRDKDNNSMLTANHEGVDAYNLHATTYLIVGSATRFEDYGEGRTGCFPQNG